GAVYVGYSLGARVALRALVDHPAIVQGVISISGTAGLETESERQARVTADETLARRLEAIGVGAFLDEWLAQPLFADLPRDQAGLPDRLGNTVAGLAESLRNCGQGRQRPLWDDLRTSTRPLLAIAGSLDLKYVALARRLASTAPHGTLTLITGAGHGAPQAMPLAVIGLVGLLAALPAISTVRSAVSASELVRALGMTARVQVVVGALFALGIIVG
ncbi:MAG: alpha/beta fold hydrolase, partial [Actinomycetota bacterium]